MEMYVMIGKGNLSVKLKNINISSSLLCVYFMQDMMGKEDVKMARIDEEDSKQ